MLISDYQYAAPASKRTMQNQGFENSVVQEVNDFALHDFINDSNFDQFIDLIRGENVIPMINYVPNYDDGHDELMFGGEIIDSQFFPPAPENVFNSSPPEPNLFLSSLPAFSGDIDIGDGDNDNDEDDSSANTTAPSKAARGDRSRTLVSERRRRSRMKEKLYALRSLVPNITKMDKASIVGDAVSYVQELQMQAKKIKAEIAVLEESLTGAGKFHQGLLENQKKPNTTATNQMRNPICRKILQMDVFQMEEKEYYVRLASNKGEGVAASLYKALESLSSFDVNNSNFSTVSERCVLACTVNVKDCGEDMNLSTMKLWVTGALLNQGFEMRTF
ncbi:Transcription factor fer-like iron deficiency-induced transcription factor [Thalictrum thalictroides]|uniref:Transcription factor fer-like iron deficiency-induced transcription factor n=1 Tax=Thalictrum thalictroides TaxID=46969 RepID=A0A7J6WJL7_THATH|nr:Transcription factor fer-like iron deficiency-induced transcription factor [Thalictrum thalictroides]